MKINLLLKQQIKINTLQNELETLQKKLKDGLYGNFIIYSDTIEENIYLKEENKKLRKKIKELKEKLK